MEKEIWKSVVGYEGYYEVSNLGNVRSVDRIVKNKNNTTKIIKGKNHKLTVAQSGYISIALYKNCEQKVYRVYRLVAEAFIPNPQNLPQINHIDENKENNNVENLEWCTGSYNVRTRSKKGERRIIQYDENGNCLLNVKITAVDAAIIDSKTNGALSDTCMQEKKPWIQSNEFDFDSVN